MLHLLAIAEFFGSLLAVMYFIDIIWPFKNDSCHSFTSLFHGVLCCCGLFFAISYLLWVSCIFRSVAQPFLLLRNCSGPHLQKDRGGTSLEVNSKCPVSK